MSKPASHSQAFLKAAAVDPEGSLAYMLMSAFGVSLAQCIAMVKVMISSKDNAVMMLCLTAAVQIRGNVVHVGPQYGDIRTKYPQLIIEGSREVKDIFNYGACHICGHILAEVSSHSLAKSILKKAGSCVTGRDFTDNEAGKINSEIFKGFQIDEVAEFKKWENDMPADQQAVVDAVLTAVTAKSATFAKQMAPAPVKV